MHGLITISHLERTVTVRGILDWFVIAFGVFALPMPAAASLTNFGVRFVAVFYLAVCSIYFIQARAYKRIAEILRDKGRLENA